MLPVGVGMPTGFAEARQHNTFVSREVKRFFLFAYAACVFLDLYYD